MADEPTACRICLQTGGVSSNTQFDNDIRTVSCARCGRYRITLSAYEDVDNNKQFREASYLISGVTRNAAERGAPLLIRTDNLHQLLASALRPSTVGEAADRLLEWIASKSSKFGESVPVDGRTDYPIIYGKDNEEFVYILDHLKQRDFVRQTPTGSAFRITPAGYEHLETLSRPNPSSTQAFVAMWFSPELKDAYEKGIEPAVRAAGYAPFRVDAVEYNDKIDDRIVAEIRKSRFLIADCTGHRGGVYFEAGLALGLGMPVIWTCRADGLDEIHFDTRQYNFIVWQSPVDFRERLTNRIVATLGQGALSAVPS
ncbi:MAG: hypothetical protein ACHQ9S_27540 [Candidatus Binatia bacterium]